jgi:hypothetical protein
VGHRCTGSSYARIRELKRCPARIKPNDKRSYSASGGLLVVSHDPEFLDAIGISRTLAL